MTVPFSKKFEIDYNLLNPDLSANFIKMMSIVQESSCAHTNSTTFPMSWFADNMKGWVIVNSRVEVYAYPKYGDMVKAETCPSKFKGMLGERNFAIYDKDNNCMLKAITTWIYTDLTLRKPIRADMEMVEDYGQTFPPYLDKDYTLPSLDMFDEIHCYDFTVMRRDIDTNLHVNNVKYIEWILEGVPEDIYLNSSISEMKANYKKECTKGDRILIRTFVKKDNNREFVSIINKLEPDGSEIIITEIYTKWK